MRTRKATQLDRELRAAHARLASELPEAYRQLQVAAMSKHLYAAAWPLDRVDVAPHDDYGRPLGPVVTIQTEARVP
jgi:hypothetical protein